MKNKPQKYMLLREDELELLSVKDVVRSLESDVSDIEDPSPMVEDIASRWENESLTYSQKLKLLKAGDVFDFRGPLTMEARKFLQKHDRNTDLAVTKNDLGAHLKSLVKRPPKGCVMEDFDAPDGADMVDIACRMFMNLAYVSSLLVPKNKKGHYPVANLTQAWKMIQEAAYWDIKCILDEVGSECALTRLMQELGYREVWNRGREVRE